MKFKIVYEYATYIHSYIMHTKLLLKLIFYAGNFIITIYYSEITGIFLILQNLHYYLAWSIVIHSIIDHINSIIYTF